MKSYEDRCTIVQNPESMKLLHWHVLWSKTVALSRFWLNIDANRSTVLRNHSKLIKQMLYCHGTDIFCSSEIDENCCTIGQNQWKSMNIGASTPSALPFVPSTLLSILLSVRLSVLRPPVLKLVRPPGPRPAAPVYINLPIDQELLQTNCQTQQHMSKIETLVSLQMSSPDLTSYPSWELKSNKMRQRTSCHP